MKYSLRSYLVAPIAASAALCLTPFAGAQDSASSGAAPDAGGPSTAPRPSTDKPIKLMAWNLEHFVDPYDDPYISNDWDDEPKVKSDAVLRLLAEAVKHADPDVFVVEEIESDRLLKLFMDSYLKGNSYRYYACLPAMEWHQNVVVASKLPINEIYSFRDVDMYSDVTKTSRNDINSRLMAVDIEANPGYQFTVYALHMKASGGPENVKWRELQADVLKHDMEKRLKADPAVNLVVMGDLNYTPQDEEYPYFMNKGDVVLKDPFEKLGFPPTHPSSGPQRSIDHIFFNDGMMKEYVPDSAAVAEPLSLNDMASISDHLPVVVTITPSNL